MFLVFFLCHKHWLDILCTTNAVFFSVSYSFWHLPSGGWGLYKRNVRFVWGIHFIRLQTSFRKHENHEKRTTLTHFLHLKTPHDTLGSSPAKSCPSDGILKKQKEKKQSHTFVLMCSYKCLDEVKIVLFLSYLWDIKGKGTSIISKPLLILMGCQRMGSRQECGCKLHLTTSFGCVCMCLIWNVKVKRFSLFFFFFNTMLF